jgi:CheY-like chemotaxis protein
MPIIHATPDGLLLVDRGSGAVVDADDAAAALLGIARDACIGLQLWDSRIAGRSNLSLSFVDAGGPGIVACRVRLTSRAEAIGLEGLRLLVSDIGNALNNALGQVVGTIDLTRGDPLLDRRSLTHVLDDLEGAALRAKRAVDRLLLVSHELEGPHAPARKHAARATPVDRLAADPHRSAVPAPGTQRVLLVDDDPVLLKITTQMLERAGYLVEACADQAAAIERVRLQRSGFDWFIIDRSLDGGSGLDLAQRLRTMRPGTPVIIVTGAISDEEREIAASIGVDSVVMKPYDFGELRHALECDQGAASLLH